MPKQNPLLNIVKKQKEGKRDRIAEYRNIFVDNVMKQ